MSNKETKKTLEACIVQLARDFIFVETAKQDCQKNFCNKDNYVYRHLQSAVLQYEKIVREGYDD